MRGYSAGAGISRTGELQHGPAPRRPRAGWKAWTAGALIPLVTSGLAGLVFAGSDREAANTRGRTFTLSQAIETALKQNPDILRSRQEIERTKGLVIEIRAQALPHLTATGSFQQTDPQLGAANGGFISNNNTTSTTGTGTGTGNGTGGGGISPTPSETVALSATPGPSVSPSATASRHAQTSESASGTTAAVTDGTASTTKSASSSNSFSSTDKSYNVQFQVSQLIYSGGQVRAALRAADLSRDITYFQLRNVVDQVISTVRQQFALILLNHELIGVQEESVRLLESQLQDQQNRFEAGTVPRFNVLQAQVALSNQRPDLIVARNNYRIAQLQLAKTIGLDFEPNRGENPPLSVIGNLDPQPRNGSLDAAIAIAKERRAFLKQQRATILNQIEQVQVALAGYKPTVRLGGGYEFRSSPYTTDIHDVAQGWFYGLTGSWAIFDGFETSGRVKQARAVLEEAKINYDDAVRQVELEVQQAYSNLQQGRELIASQSKNVEEAEEALRLSSARLSAGAGTQLEVLNARVELTRAQSTRLQALYTYNTAVAEFDRVTATDTVYHETFDDPLTHKRKAPKPSATPGRRLR